MYSGSVGLIKNAQARLSMRSNLMTGSLTNIHHAAQNPTQNGYQYGERSKSVDPFQMMNGSSSSSQPALNQPMTSSQIGFQESFRKKIKNRLRVISLEFIYQNIYPFVNLLVQNSAVQL